MSAKPSIPAWQRASATSPSKDSPQEAEPDSNPAEEPADETQADTVTESDADSLRAQAQKWLQDPSIQDAPVQKKLDFLLSKGISREVADELVRAEPQPKTTLSSTVETSPQPRNPSKQSEAPRAVAPVITYPEFLLHSNEPPPLVTTNFLLNTTYFASGLAATLYGVSKYLVAPMQEALQEARHDFLSHSISKIEGINDKMEGMVSIIPSAQLVAGKKSSEKGGDEDDAESDDSDPTELYHRDIGVQTSPSLSRNNSVSSTDDLSDSPSRVLVEHESALKRITSRLSELRSSEEAQSKESDVSTQLRELASYLSDMRYSSPYYGWKGGNQSWMGSASQEKKEVDEVERVRAEIRGIKGVLLSTRNFPRIAFAG